MAKSADGKSTKTAGGKDKRGFASMDPEKRRAIAASGGKSVPKEKRSFSKDRTLASAAGRKGGLSTPAERRTFSQDRQGAAEAGRKGGLAGTKAKPAP